MIAATLANVHRGKSQPAYTTDDFMLKNQTEKRQAETRSVLAFLDAVAVKNNG